MVEDVAVVPIEPDDLEAVALACGLIQRGEKMPIKLIEYTSTIVFHCSALVEGYTKNCGDAHDVLLAAFGLEGPTRH